MEQNRGETFRLITTRHEPGCSICAAEAALIQLAPVPRLC